MCTCCFHDCKTQTLTSKVQRVMMSHIVFYPEESKTGNSTVFVTFVRALFLSPCLLLLFQRQLPFFYLLRSFFPLHCSPSSPPPPPPCLPPLFFSSFLFLATPGRVARVHASLLPVAASLSHRIKSAFSLFLWSTSNTPPRSPRTQSPCRTRAQRFWWAMWVHTVHSDWTGARVAS